MKVRWKKISAIVLACVMTAGMLSGCGKIKSSDTVVTMGDQKISLGLANFYARYYEGMYETYYGIDESSWTSSVTGEEGKATYESTVKDSVLENLENMYLEKAHMGDYDVTLTDDEKKEITDAVNGFMESNELEAKNAVSGDEKTVTEFLTLLKIQNKMKVAMTKDVDTEVSDEEAAQKAMSYVVFSLSTTDEDGNVTPLTDDEKSALMETAKSFAEGAKTAEDFAAYVSAAGYEAQDATFDAESTTPEEAVCKAADALGEGEVSDVIEGTDGYYVAKVTSLMDKDATEAKKTEIVDKRKSDQIESLLKDWKKGIDIKVNKRAWDKVDFSKQGIIMIQTEETTPGSEDTTGTAAE